VTHYELKRAARAGLAAGLLSADALNALPRDERRAHLAGLSDAALYAQACLVALGRRLAGPAAAMACWEWERVVEHARCDRLRAAMEPAARAAA
jgi:hypothetical protein